MNICAKYAAIFDYDKCHCSQIGCNLEQSNQVLIDLIKKLIPGVKEIVELYKRAGWDLYIASNSSRDEFMQKTLNNSNKEMRDSIKDNFNLQNIVCGDDHGVIDKEKYGLIKEKISLEPKDCLVFKDLFHGTRPKNEKVLR
ncbi:5203_t:CDS:2 [Gigaspora margarita]|uniref:5203_t:CDS:1 n=1 Tax=Gigaspora margarita TaxID=4874 RepID=A0ABN7UW08_GIGMA|nr:5203_t:CDS:2 [Gigaspora margarita]